MPIRPVVVRFQAEGISEAARAFRTVKQGVEALDNATIQSGRKVARERGSSAKQGAELSLRWQKYVQRENARLDKEEVSSKARAEREKTAAAKREVDQRTRLEKLALRESDRANREIVRNHERAERERTRATKRETDERVRAEKRETAERERTAKRYGRAVGAGFGNVVGGIARVGGAALAIGGGFGVVDALQGEIGNKAKARLLANNSGGVVKRDDILAQSKANAFKYGFSTSDVLDATDAFGQKSGRYKDAPGMTADILKLANATGTSASELGTVAGIYAANNQSASNKDVAEWLRVSAGMGREGSVDLRELAQYGGRVSAAAGQFGNKEVAFRQLSAMTQTAAALGGAGDAAGSTEAIKAFQRDLSNNRGYYKQLTGSSAYDSRGEMIDPRDIVVKAISATKGDTGKLHDVFKRESMMAVQGYGQLYREAYNNTQGSNRDKDAAGIKAVNREFDRLEKAAMSAAQVESDNASRMEEEDKKLIVAFEKLRSEVGEKLIPEVTKAIPVISSLVPALTNMLGFAVKNPFATLGIVLAASITKEVAAAGVSRILEGAATRAAASIASSGGLLSGNMMAAAGGVAAAAAIIYAASKALDAGEKHIDTVFAQKVDAQDDAALNGRVDQGVRANILRKIKKGEVLTDDERRAANEIVTKQTRSVDRQVHDLDPDNKSWTEKLIGSAGQGIIGKAMGFGEAAQMDQISKMDTLNETKSQLEELKKALEKNTQATMLASDKFIAGGGKASPDHPARNRPTADR